MRERTIKRSANHIFWLIIYLLPIISMLFYAIANSGNTEGTPTSGNEWREATVSLIGISGTHENLMQNNVIYKTIYDMFGTGTYGIKILENYRIQTSSTYTYSFTAVYITYIAEITLIRLSLSLIMFLPRLGIKYLKKLGGEDCEIC